MRDSGSRLYDAANTSSRTTTNTFSWQVAPGDDDVLRKVSGDLKDKGHAVSETEVRHQMDHLLQEAKVQVATE